MANPQIKIYGTIGGDYEDSVTVSDVNSQLEAIGDVPDIDVSINSSGGIVTQGIAIANLLKKHPAKIHTIIEGAALSIAGYIACCGDTRTMSPDALFHVHGPRVDLAGANQNDLEDHLKQVSSSADSMAVMYSKVTGKTDDEIKELFSRENYYSAEEALAEGFMTQIGEPSGVAALIDTKRFDIPDKFAAALARCGEQPPEDLPDMSKTIATVQNLKDGLKKAPDSFIVSQAIAGVSMEEARANYIDLLELQIPQANASAEEDEEAVAMEDEPKPEESTAEDDLIEKIVAKVMANLNVEDEVVALEDEDEEVVAMEDEDEEAVAMEDEDEEVVAMDENKIMAMVNAAVAKFAESKNPTKAPAKASAKKKKQGRNSLGTKAIRKANVTPRQATHATAQAELASQASAMVKEGNGQITLANARQKILTKNPELRERMVAEAN